MKALERRVEALEGPRGFYSMGDWLDNLDGTPMLPEGKRMHPGMAAWLDSLSDDDEAPPRVWPDGIDRL